MNDLAYGINPEPALYVLTSAEGRDSPALGLIAATDTCADAKERLILGALVVGETFRVGEYTWTRTA